MEAQSDYESSSEKPSTVSTGEQKSSLISKDEETLEAVNENLPADSVPVCNTFII